MGQSQSRRESTPPERTRDRISSAFRPSSYFVAPSSRRPARDARARRRSQINADLFDDDDSSDTGRRSPSPPLDLRRRSRLSRSLTSTIPSFLQRDRDTSQRFPRHNLTSPPLYHDFERSSPHGSNGSLLPSVPQEPALDIDFSNLSMDSDQPSASDSRRPIPRSATNVSDRASSLTAARPFRNLPRNLTASLRRRRPATNRNDDSAATLARLLSMTAAATAASLMGVNSDAAVTDLRDAAGVVDDDGTFDGFLQALRAGGLQAALGRRESANSEGEDNPNPAALDFFRMFRFGAQGPQRNQDSTGQGSTDQSQPQAQPAEAPNHTAQIDEENAEGRMIPVLIVGIRSFNAEVEARDGNTPDNSMPSFLDALTNFPTTINIGLSDGAPPGFRQPRTGVRVSSRRRASMGGLNLFSGGRESARRARQYDAQRPHSEYRPSNQDTPPGPFPPPTTPSSPPISALSSGSTTPNGRVSPTPAGVNMRPSRREHHATQANSHLEPPVEDTATSARSGRSRRRSESDFTRFGAGSSRRNGTYLEPPDSSETTTDNSNSNTTTRSWIIYILGGSYPENHPILTTPSLFTDSPTYEDLLLLSSLIGPAKPPVATAEDVASAGGLYRIRTSKSGVAYLRPETARTEADDITLTIGERCLVCLCDYQEDDEVRRLVKCDHAFHRECIDQWLTTGRNSCPLCRGQGVEEKSSDETATGEAGPSAQPTAA